MNSYWQIYVAVAFHNHGNMKNILKDFKKLKSASSRSVLWQCQNLVSIKAKDWNQSGSSIKLAAMIKPEQTH